MITTRAPDGANKTLIVQRRLKPFPNCNWFHIYAHSSVQRNEKMIKKTGTGGSDTGSAGHDTGTDCIDTGSSMIVVLMKVLYEEP